MNRNRLYFFIAFYLLFSLLEIKTLKGQTINTLTKEDGLPSLHLYNIIEDRSGFLWIGSDNGLIRYDGSQFYTYTILEGLPSNEVIQVGLDETGNIWANCIGSPPYYLSPRTNNFYRAKFKNSKFESNGYAYFSMNAKNELIYISNKSYKLNKEQAFEVLNLLSDSNKQIIPSSQSTYNKFLPFKISINHSKTRVEKSFNKVNAVFDSKSNQLYYCTENSKVLYRLNYANNSIHPTIDSAICNSPIVRFFISNNYIGLQQKTRFSVYNLPDFSPFYELNIDKIINEFYIKVDKLWLTTPEDGFLEINLRTYPKNYAIFSNSTILSIDVNRDRIATGNYNSEIKESYQQKSSIKTIHPNNLWIRKLIIKDKDIYTLSEPFITKNYTEKIWVPNPKRNKPLSGLKSMIFVNDSVLGIGHAIGLSFFNLNTKTTTNISSISGRIYELSKAYNNSFYFIYKDSLWFYNYTNNSLKSLSVKMNFENEQIKKLYRIDANSLWIATNYGRLILIKNEKEISSIYNPNHLPQVVNGLVGNKSTLFIGGSDFLSIIHYNLHQQKRSYTLYNLSTQNGLSSNTIMELALFNDTVYIATDKGLTSLPITYRASIYPIETYLVKFLANNKLKELDTKYQLASDENSISMEFSGAGLMGNFKYFEYSIDDSLNWKKIENKSLNLIFKSGNHTLYIRAVDIHGNKNKISTYILNVEYPFYQKLYFWAGLLIIGIIGFFLLKKFRIQQYAARQMKEQIRLNEQKQQITADLHDDIGASLSSLQINCAVANQLLDTDIEKSKTLFKKIESQAELLADLIGDFIWSMHTQEEEFMTLSGRIKTFANEILESTSINYTIKIDPEIDTVFTSSITRKNIVLICKEALNNAVKYSQAETISLSFIYNENSYILSIIDNGIGMNLNQIQKRGIENMRKRANDITANFSIISSINKGVRINIIFTPPNIREKN